MGANGQFRAVGLQETIPRVNGIRSRAQTWLELTKPNLSLLVVVTGLFGYCLETSGESPLRWSILAALALGTGLTSAGACGLNMAIEYKFDALMRRTQDRPIPTLRISRREAYVLSIALYVLGFFILWTFTGPIPALLSLFTMLVYVVLYTPLKRKGPIAIWVGAVPGAIPPLMGGASATGGIGGISLLLFLILFAWQFPHFIALAWMYREDYKRAGFRMLPENDEEGRVTARYILAGCLVLLLTSLAPVFFGLAGTFYSATAMVLGLGFTRFAFLFWLSRTAIQAKHAFLASVAYLPLLFTCLLIDRAL